MMKTDGFTPKNEQRCLILLLFHIILEVPDHKIREDEGVKEEKMGKTEVKLTYFTDDRAWYTEYPKPVNPPTRSTRTRI